MSSETHRKIEFIIEKAALPKLRDVLQEVGARGYTIVPVVEGCGEHGRRRAADLSDVFDNVMVIVVTDRPTSERLLERCATFIQQHVGIVYGVDVEVIRQGRFTARPAGNRT